MPGPLNKFGIAFIGTLPTLATIFLMAFFTLPIRLSFFELMPMLIAVASVYYWSIYRPEYMPIGAVFLLGLVHDFFSGGPFAATALALLALHLVTLTQRETLAGKSFIVIWLALVIVGLVPAETDRRFAAAQLSAVRRAGLAVSETALTRAHYDLSEDSQFALVIDEGVPIGAQD